MDRAETEYFSRECFSRMKADVGREIEWQRQHPTLRARTNSIVHSQSKPTFRASTSEKSARASTSAAR